MPRTIYKYEIQPAKEGVVCHVELPVGAEVLSVKVVNGGIFVWAYVNPEERSTYFENFAIIPTGLSLDDEEVEELENNYVFMDTLVMMEGLLILHVFRGM